VDNVVVDPPGRGHREVGLAGLLVPAVVLARSPFPYRARRGGPRSRPSGLWVGALQQTVPPSASAMLAPRSLLSALSAKMILLTLGRQSGIRRGLRSQKWFYIATMRKNEANILFVEHTNARSVAYLHALSPMLTLSPLIYNRDKPKQIL